MPNRFSLTRKSNKDAGPVSLSQIDEEIRAHFGVASDPKKYYHQWADSIGLALASGQSFDEIIDDCNEAIEEQSKIANQQGIDYWNIKLTIAEFLQEYFISNCWTHEEIGRD